MFRKFLATMTAWLLIGGSACYVGAVEKNPVVVMKTSMGTVKIKLLNQNERAVT